MTNEATETQANFDVEGLKSPEAGIARLAEQHCIARAEAGNVEAAEALSAAYNDGYPCIRRDAIKAYRYTARAADLGSSFSRYWLAKLQRDSGDYGNAIVNVKMALGLGESAATVLLADMLLRGQGCSAAPMEALDMLAQAAEGSDSDAALALADHLLSGQFIPRDPTRAYEVLSSHDIDLQVLELIAPGTEGKFLYLKACALRDGAQVKGAPEWTQLMGLAADAGHGAARTERDSLQARQTRANWDKQWDDVATFRVYGIAWELFFVSGTLRHLDQRSSSSVGQVGTVITTNTARWIEGLFEMGQASRTIKFERKANLTVGRTYHLVYCGKSGSGTGTPLMVMDSVTHDVVKATGGLTTAYPKETANTLCKLVLFFAVALVIGLWLKTFVLGFIGAVGWGVLAYKCMVAPKERLNAAVDAALRHLSTLKA